MRFISRSVVAAVATMSVLAVAASSASATITPTTGTFTATNTGNVTFLGTVANICSTVDLHGDINMDNPAGQGGGGVITGWTLSGCSPQTFTGDFAPPWTVNINNRISATTWSGTLTGIKMTLSLCTYTGSLPLHYSNTTGTMSVSGGSLSGGLCGSVIVTAHWDLRSGAGIPMFS
jgi:hypothetical protein